MNKRMKALLVSTSSAMAVALVALSFALGGARAVRAEDPAALAVERPDMVLISAAALDRLDQRVSDLEGIVASLTLASQHISTSRLCISGADGEETCLTKPQLDALLAIHAPAVEIAEPTHGSSGSPVPATDAEKENEKVVVTTASEPELPPVAADSQESPKSDPETTGSIAPPADAPAEDE
jgi:hypothetical protein